MSRGYEKVAVTGDQDFSNTEMIRNVLSSFIEPGVTLLNQGSSHCAEIAKELGAKVKTYPIKNDLTLNKQMMNDAEILIVFPCGKNTKNYIEQAEEADIPAYSAELKRFV